MTKEEYKQLQKLCQSSITRTPELIAKRNEATKLIRVVYFWKEMINKHTRQLECCKKPEAIEKWTTIVNINRIELKAAKINFEKL